MPLRWFVTRVTDPHRPLDGPFESRDDCERRCLERMSETNKIDAAWNHDGEVTRYYVPHPFRIESVHVADPAMHIYVERPQTQSSVPRKEPQAQAQAGVKLPASIYKLERAQLLDLALSLGVDKAALTRGLSRSEIVILMENYLNGR